MSLVRVAVEADAEAARAFEVLTDWPRQREWMILTHVDVIAGDGRSPGSRLSAFTGVGRVGFTDPMVVTVWRPPSAVTVAHEGRMVRGTGEFRVVPLPGGRSRIEWEEHLDLPLGALGRAAWLALKPLTAALLKLSLRRLAHLASRP